MSDTKIDLSFLSENKSFALTVAQLQAMDKELQDIAQRSPELIALSRAFDLTYANAAKLTKELGLAPAQLREAVGTMQSLRAAGADAVTQYAVFAKQLGLTVEQMQLLADTVEELGGKEDVVSNLTQALSGLFVIDKVNQFKASVLETGKVLETLQARLKTTLGTKASADDALDRIQKFAATTPFEMVEVTDSFVKLKQRGIDPTNKALQQLGDLAASQGKSLDQTTEALLDASQGEFERLKEFGIKASAAGDKVNVSFQGVNKQITRTPEGIAEGILALGALEGVAGGMEERAKTLGGAQSNLTDATTKLSGAAFELVQGPAVALIQQATKLIDTFFSLDKGLQKMILTVGVGGAVLVSAVAAVQAFRAAQIGAAIALGVKTAAQLPSTIATAASTVVNTLATVAEFNVGAAVKGSAASLVAKTVALGTNTAAVATNAAAMATGNAVTSASTAAMISNAAAFGLVAGAALAAAAAIVIVADTYLEITEGERAADEAIKSLDKSLAAVDEGAKKRAATNAANAKAATDGANAAKRDAMTYKELASTNAANDAEIQAAYNKQAQEKLSWIQKILDKVREFVNLPSEAFARVFELTAKLPLPNVVKDWLNGAAAKIREFQLKSAAEGAKDSDILGFNKLIQGSNELGDKLKETKRSAEGGILGNASKQEVEGLVNGYTDLISTLEKVQAKDGAQQTQKDFAIRQLKAEQKEVEQANKLIKEKEKRVTAVGTAEAQWAAEVRTVNENIGKQIATSEDANKAIEITKKQLEAGFISPDEAQTVFQQIANYTQATGDVQIAAANEVNAIKAKQFDNEKAFLENSIQLAELQGITEVKTAEETAATVAGIRRQQAELEVKELEAKIEALAKSGRRNSTEGIAAEKELAAARVGLSTATAQQEVANRADASAKINKALKDAEDARSAAESKAAISSKGKVLAAIKDGNLSIEDAEKEADKESLARQQASLAAEIALKQSKQAELAKVGGKAAKEEAEKLGQEVLQLQEKQLDLEITAVKKAQKEKLDAIREETDKRKADSGLSSANADAAIAQQELALYKDQSRDRADVDEQANQLRLKASEKQLQAQLAITQQEIASTRQAVAEGVLSKKDGDKQIIQLETELAGKRSALTKNSLDQFKAAEAARRREIEDTLRRQSEAASAKSDSGAAAGEAEIARLRIANASKTGEALQQVEEQIATKRVSLAKKAAESQLAIAKLEQAAIEQKISANLISRKDADTERLKSSTAVVRAENALTEAQADVQAQAAAKAKKLREDAVKDIEREVATASAKVAQAEASAAIDVAKLKASRAKASGDELLAIDEAIIERRAGFAQKAATEGLRAAQAQERIVSERIKAGLIEAKDAATAKLIARNATAQAEAKLIDANAELELEAVRKVERARQRAQQAQIASLDKVKQSLQREQELLSQSNALLAAQDGLENARAGVRTQMLGFRKQDIDLAIQAAQAAGDEKAAEELGLKAKEFELAVVKAQASEIARQYDIKLRNLELDIESKQIAAEQLVLEKQIAVLEAEGALASGQAEGKSAQELAALQQKVSLTKQALELSEKSQSNVNRVGEVQKQTLAIERGSALQANQQQVNQLTGQAQIEKVKAGKASSSTLSGLIGKGQTAASGAVPLAESAIPVAASFEATTAASNLLGGKLSELAEGASKVGITLMSLDLTLTKANSGKPGATQGKPKVAGARASGGSGEAGSTYLVGELGPELVTFNQPGYVHAAGKTSQMLNAALGAVSNAQPGVDASSLSSEEIVRQLAELNRRVSARQSISPVEVPVNVTTQTVDGVAMALSVVRADRAARYNASSFG